MNSIVNKKTLKNFYKQNPPVAGVFLITNIVNQKKFLGTSPNVPAAFNRIKTELKMGDHRNKALMSDWLEYGEANFEFKIIDQLDMESINDIDVKKELKTLHELWLEKLMDCEYN